MRSKPYCLAPFYHGHYDVNFKNKMCCIAQNELVEEQYQSDLELRPSEFWTSNYMSDRREKMMRNEAPPECELCSNPITTYKYKDSFLIDAYLDSYNSKSEENLRNWKELPVSLDVRNIECNLKCIMCEPASSTSMAAHFKKHTEDLVEFFGEDFLPIRNPDVQDFFLEDFLKYCANSNVRFIYFAGGEPLMNPKHFEMLDHIYKNTGEVVTIFYNTNLMLPEKRIDDWISQVKRFNSVTVACSIDATEELGSYLRVGFKHSVFDRNLNALKAVENFDLLFDVTLTSLGLLDFENLMRYAVLNNVPLRIRKVIDPTAAQFLTIGFLTEKEKRACVDSLRAYFESLKPNQRDLFSDFSAAMTLILDTPEMTGEQREYSLKAAEVFDKIYPKEFQFKQRYERLAQFFR